jgi:hypothetical protein
MSDKTTAKMSLDLSKGWAKRVYLTTTGLGVVAGIGLTPYAADIFSAASKIIPSASAYVSHLPKLRQAPPQAVSFVSPEATIQMQGASPYVYGQPVYQQGRFIQTQPVLRPAVMQDTPTFPELLNYPVLSSVYVPPGLNPYAGRVSQRVSNAGLVRFVPPQNLGPIYPAPSYAPLTPTGGEVSWDKITPNLEASQGEPSRSRSHFRFSVNGHAISGDGFEEEAGQIKADQALARSNIQVRIDGLAAEPWLNVGALSDSVHVSRHGPVEFVAYSNYDAFIARAEIRVFAAPAEGSETLSETTLTHAVETDKPLFVLPLNTAGRGQFFAPPQMPDKLLYQLRVYDGAGRFDETLLRRLQLADEPYRGPDHIQGLGAYGQDATSKRNISIRGEAVTINGSQIPHGVTPYVLGRSVPTDGDGQFAIQQILPFGKQPVDVVLADPMGGQLRFQRHVELKETDLFYVALGDLTIGEERTIGLSDLTDPGDEFDSVDIAGRGAFYLKGRIKGDTLITAALDTGEASLDDLLSNLDDKDPRQLLRRLNAEDYYPVYGDGSRLREDAPTQGRFYVRLEKDDSTLLWGNFATAVQGTEIAQLDRGLYGALADLKSQGSTSFGERRSQATVFAADPGTLAGRDEFRGTGGSLYYIQRQDITVGSERLRIEVRDKVTGLVVETRPLTAFEDYTIDYLQGRILLTEPLQSTVSDNQIVRTGSLSGHEAYLVARYEYTPGVTALDGYTIGGRATQWLGEKLRIGATAQRETTGEADQTVMAADVLLRLSDTSYIKGEFGQSEGQGFNEARTTDGGFLFDEVQAPGQRGVKANAYRVEGQMDLLDGSRRGFPYSAKIRGIYEHQESGYSGQGRIGYGEVTRAEVGFDGALSDRTRVSVQYDDLKSESRGESRALYADLTQKLSRDFSVAFGVRHTDQDPTTINNLSPNSVRGTGARTDATVEARYAPSDTLSVRAFYQDTLQQDTGRAAATRYGGGGDIRLSQHARLSGEVSDGDGGLGASAQLNIQNPEGAEYYIGYAVSADNQDSLTTTPAESYSTYGTITAGAKRRYSDALSIYGEEKLSFGDSGQNFSHAYGIDFRPTARWAFGAGAEIGTINDDVIGDFKREAFSLSAAYTGPSFKISSNGEARFERGVLNARNRDRNTYFVRNSLAYQAGRDLELLGRLNLAISESDQSSILDADFVEGVLGMAYRPVENDRFNALLKYTFYEDLSPADQGANDTSNRRRINARQKSHIVSADGTYELTDTVSLGGKLAYRMGEVETVRGSDVFLDSDVGLAVLRADVHMMNKWDAFFEGRYLTATLADDSRYGSLIGMHRHIGDNIKFGGGYSFSGFSDDLTDYRDDSDGWFINLVGKL